MHSDPEHPKHMNTAPWRLLPEHQFPKIVLGLAFRRCAATGLGSPGNRLVIGAGLLSHARGLNHLFPVSRFAASARGACYSRYKARRWSANCTVNYR